MEWLESRAVRPRQARYQAALRPDMQYSSIIKHFPVFLGLESPAVDGGLMTQFRSPVEGETKSARMALQYRLC